MRPAGRSMRAVPIRWAGAAGDAAAATLSLRTGALMASVSGCIDYPLATLFFGYFAVMEWRRSF